MPENPRLSTILLATTCCILMIGMAGFGQTTSPSYFGMHIGKTSTPWPAAQFGSLRLWDDGVAWTSINTSKGTYKWSTLDTWVRAAQQHNAALTYTFGRTPQWASSSPGLSSCDYGPGQCVAPANYTDWDNFVTQLVTRYKGQIQSYELWNEPNDNGFWQGTTAEMVELSCRASGIIRSIDPNAQILSPAATWKKVTAWQWLDGYFTAGGAACIDVVSFHGYTGSNRAESIFSIIDNVQQTMNLHGVNMPMVISEGGWGLNTVISDPDAQAAFLVQRYLLIQARPAVQSFFWYMWDDINWGTLWDARAGMHKAGVAYREVSKWLTGADRNGCTQAADSTWSCSFTRANGYQALAVWNAVAPKSYTPAAQYVTYRAIDGSVSQIAGGSAITVSNKPILLETGSASTLALSVNLSVTPNAGILPVNVSANVTATTDPSATITSTTIDFGNGTVINGSTGSVQYSAAGTYTVIATVKDSLGRTTTKNAVVTATANQAPLAALSVSPASGPAPLAVSASTAGSADSDGSIASSVIDFGDGTVVNGPIASHVYAGAGAYIIRGTVTDNLGASASATITATATSANQLPVAKLTTTQTAPMSVNASTAGSFDPDGSIKAITINWGDGAISNGAAASHTYSKPGTYIVTASVTDNLGAVSKATAIATPRFGVMFTSPTRLTSSPVHIVALAASNVQMKTMKLYVDGGSTYTLNSWLLDTHLTLSAGTHQLLVQAWDSNGVTYKLAMFITVH